MNTAEYDSQMKEIRDDYLVKCKKLRIQFVASNTTVRVGDVIKDHSGSIVVEKTGVNVPLTGYPEPKFYGIELKKDGTPRKDKAKRWLFGCNM